MESRRDSENGRRSRRIRELVREMSEMQLIQSAIAIAGASAAGGLMSWAALAPSSQLFGNTIRETGDASTIAITFDDGPNPAVTPQLLDLLDLYEAKATFFLIGRFVKSSPALAKEIALRGHTIGNHTHTHPLLGLQSSRRIAEELRSCHSAIEDATGRKVRWMRPPFGFRGPQLTTVLKSRGDEPMVMWSIWARDWKPQRAEHVIERLRRAKGGDIVLLHDGDHRAPEGDRRHVLAALKYWLPRWKSAGLRFVTMDDLKMNGRAGG